MEVKSDAASRVADLLAWLEPAMVPPLFPPPVRAALQALAVTMPPARFLLFECHLGATPPRIDLSLGQIAALPTDLDLPALRAHPGPILLEYDLGLAACPAIFACFSHRAPATGAGLSELAAALLASLAPEAIAMLDRAAAAQGTGEAWITQFGAMRSRAHQPIRLNIGGRSCTAIQGYAERIGTSPASLALLETWFDLATGLDADFILAIDVADRVLPRIGLEFYFRDAASSGQFLDRLCEQGLCNAAELAGIALWNEEGRVARRLNHLKLVGSSGDDVRAKAYLAARYHGGADAWEPRA
jgi:hypothetical protein